MKLKRKKGLVLFGIFIAIIVIILGTVFLMVNQNTVEASNEVVESQKMKLPNFKLANMNFDVLPEAVSTEVPENEGATEEELQKEKVTKTSNSNTAPYYIVVNYNANVVTIYKKDKNNEYTVPVKAMVCSTGVATPKSGVYKLTNTRYKWRALFGGVYGQYAVKIVGNILFHSVPYLSTDNSTLEYWEYDKLGTSASAGCIRLTVTDAIWIYNNCGSGTQVEFSANAPTPLGKPTAKKISGYPELRGYDPTDPVANNPWKNANVSTKTEENPQTNKVNNTTTTVEKTEEEQKEPSKPTTEVMPPKEEKPPVVDRIPEKPSEKEENENTNKVEETEKETDKNTEESSKLENITT